MSYIQNNQIEETGLTPGKFTLFLVDEYMALTHRLEIQLIELRKVESYAQYKNIIEILFKLRGKRKESIMKLKESMLFLPGWDLGIKIDTDFNTFCGSALINLVGEPKELMDKIIKNVFKFANLGIVSYANEEHPSTVLGMLFKGPAMEAAPNHASVRRIMESVKS